MSRPVRLLALALALFLGAGCILAPAAEPAPLTIGSTTSARDTGLLDVLIPAFTADTGIPARAVVVGSGAAMEQARRGDVDVLLTHAPALEEALVADGVALHRAPVMENRFVLVGPEADPAGVRNAPDAVDAMRRVSEAGATFASRGDESGTHQKERALWDAAGLDPESFPRAWYKELDQGQAGALRYAQEKRAYTLTDESTWWVLADRGTLDRLDVLFAGDARLRNPYSVLPVDEAVVPGVRTDLALAFEAWVTGPRGQAVIAELTINGRQVFTPTGEGDAS